MFKKKCKKCRQKINNNFEFCPFCGKDQKSVHDEKDYGFIGKNDFIEEKDFFSELGDSFMEKMFSTAFKMLEKQMKNLPQELAENSKPKFQEAGISGIPNNLHMQLFVNGKRVFPQFVERKQNNPQTKKPIISISKERLEKISKLPREEPVSKLKRISGKVIYELDVPGVREIEDIIINRLENSIEIKALSKDKVYSKILNINLPILGYKLSNGNLIVEFQGH